MASGAAGQRSGSAPGDEDYPGGERPSLSEAVAPIGNPDYTRNATGGSSLDIDVTLGQVTFAARTAAIFLHEGHVLLHNSDADDLWALPGGRIRAMESSEVALRREMAEELNADITVGPLQWVVENFFEYDGRRWHEIGLYHLAEFRDSSWYDLSRTYRGLEGATLGLTLKWVPLSRAGELNLVPRALPKAFQELPCGLKHIVNNELLNAS